MSFAVSRCRDLRAFAQGPKRVQDTRLGRKVAIKVVPSPKLSEDPAFQRRLSSHYDLY